MADRKPLKVLPDSASGTGGGDSTGLGEFLAADTVGVLDGGTGILLGNGTSAIAASAAMTTNGTLLIGGTGGPEVATLTAGSNITLTNGDGAITIAAAAGGLDAANGLDNRIATFSDADSLNGEQYLTFDGSVLAVTGAMTMANAAGPTIVNEAATATNPTLIPNKAEVDTGLGWAAADSLSLITGGTERVRVTANGSLAVGTTAVPGGYEGVGSATFYKDANNYISCWDNAVATLTLQANGANTPTIGMNNGDGDQLQISMHQRSNAGGNILGHSRNGLASIQTSANLAGLFAIGTAGADHLVFSTTDAERMRVYASGSVAIGTNPPDSYGLAIQYGGSNPALRTYNTTQSGSALQIYDGHASTDADIQTWATEKAASTDYNFIFSYTGGNSSNEAFKLQGDGNGLAEGTWQDNAFDYAEYFESTDGEALPVGKSVVLENGKVRVYTDADSTSDIVGIVRPKGDAKGPAAHNTAWNGWHLRDLTDDYGTYLREDVTVWEWDEVKYVDGDVLPEGKEVGDVKIEAGTCYEFKELAKDPDWTPLAGATSSTQSIRKRNPAYDESLADNYKPRKDRAEWNLIGLLGQVPVTANEPVHPHWIKMKQISDSVDMWLVR